MGTVPSPSTNRTPRRIRKSAASVAVCKEKRGIGGEGVEGGVLGGGEQLPLEVEEDEGQDASDGDDEEVLDDEEDAAADFDPWE